MGREKRLEIERFLCVGTAKGSCFGCTMKRGFRIRLVRSCRPLWVGLKILVSIFGFCHQ